MVHVSKEASVASDSKLVAQPVLVKDKTAGANQMTTLLCSIGGAPKLTSSAT